jgi:hypothetical protein
MRSWLGGKPSSQSVPLLPPVWLQLNRAVDELSAGSVPSGLETAIDRSQHLAIVAEVMLDGQTPPS